MTDAAGDAGRREVRRAVADLVRSRPELVEDQDRMRGYMRDVCPTRPAEVAVIVVAAGAGVPEELTRADQGHALEALSARLANRLQVESGIDGDLARWAVDTWALALRPAAGDVAPSPSDGLRAMVAGAKPPAPGAGTPGDQVTTPPPAPPVVGPTRAPPVPAPAPEAPKPTVHRRPAPAEPAAPATETAPSWRARARSPMLLGGAAAAGLVLVLLVVALAGGGGSDPPVAPDSASATTAAATTAPVPTTVAPTTTTQPANPLPAAPASLGAGRYAATTFQPNLTVTVPDGWRLGTQRADLLELSPADAESDVLSVVRAVRPLRRDRTFPTGADTQGAGAVEPAPADFVAWLRSHDRLSVSPSTAATVGGVVATQVDVTLRAGYTRDFCGRCVSILQLDDGIVFNLVEANVSRIYSFTVGGAPILVVLEATPDRLQAFVSRVDTIVRSLTFAR